MKKLLMIGLILMLGITTFAGVEVELNRDSTSGNTYSGKGYMNVGSTGYAVEGAGTGTLVVTPTMSEGADGTSLEFSFGNLVKGATGTVNGRFKAEIVMKEGVALPLNNKVSAKLQTVTIGDTGNIAITDKADKIENIALMGGNTPTQFGTLSYELTNKRENNAGKTYEAEVITTVKIKDDAAFVGTFSDKSARVLVEVTGWTAPKATIEP